MRRLSEQEAAQFLIRHGLDRDLQDYLASRQLIETGEVIHRPPWGITVMDDGRQYLIYQATTDNPVAIVDVTGEPIAAQVDAAPYISPNDMGFWDNFTADFETFLDKIQGAFVSGVFVVGVGLALYAVIKYGPRRR